MRVSGTVFMIAGLQPTTAYTARVRPVYNDRVGIWTLPFAFRTTQLLAPQLQPVALCTGKGAALEWTSSDPPAEVYDVEVTCDGKGLCQL